MTSGKLEIVLREESYLNPNIVSEAVDNVETLNLKEIDPLELMEQYAYCTEIPKGAAIIDCRTKDEFNTWHHPDAVRMDLPLLIQSFKRFTKNRPYILCCAIGVQTATVAEADVSDSDPLDYFNFAEITEAGSSTKRFLSLLSGLYAISGEQFAKACVLKGSKREYFSQDKGLLLASGKTSKPQAIPNSPYWVITNTNTARKRHILQHVASEMGLQEFQIERLCEAV